MKNLIVGLVLLASFVFGGGCASRKMSQMDVSDRVEIPVLLDGKVYTNSFSHVDKSKIASGDRRNTGRRRGGTSWNFFRVRAEVGGGGGYGYPVVTVPLESQDAFHHQTMQRYGLGGSGSYSPTPMGGTYYPTPMGSYSPTPMR